MIENKFKIRKEKFGWIVCKLDTCEVYEVSEDLAKILQIIKEIDLNKSNDDELAKLIKRNFQSESLVNIKEILVSLKNNNII